MKRLTTLLTLLLLLGSQIATRADILTGTCGADEDGANLSYTLDTETGTLTINGSGDMKDYTAAAATRAPWYDYRTSINTIVLPEGLTRIGNCAFYQCSSFVSITLPASLTSIGNGAFTACTALADITVKALTPPVISPPSVSSSFPTSLRYKGCFHVPEEALDAYYDDANWCDFVCAVGQFGRNLFWSLDEETGTLTITGSGTMRDFSTSF